MDVIITESPEETINYAKTLGAHFKPGDIYGFNGQLSAGKTTFIKGLLNGLGYQEMVNSPTFTLINEYSSKYKIVHIDCYREKDINRWLDLGIYEYFSSDYIVLIEWPEIISEILPKTTKFINLEIVNLTTRKITIC